MPGGRSGLYPGIEKKHQSAQYKQYEADNDLLLDVGRARLLELARAEKEGRLVVLPCKVGDKVYRMITTLNAAPIITEVEIKTLGQAVDLIGRIGKKQLLVSWYLTREEAETALKKREEEDNEAD